jgi:molybdate transport system substrate-binding protein
MWRLTSRWLAIAGLTLALAAALAPNGSAAPPPDKTTLNVYAAASLVDAFEELGRVLERRRPGLKVRMNFAGSQQLASQLAQGGRADVFASADERWMRDVQSHGLLARDAATFARNRMVVIVPAVNPARIARLQDIARPGVKLVLCADAVPAGRYSREVIRNLGKDAAFGGDFAARALQNVVSEEENVRAVVAKVQLGEADAGIVYRSDVSAKLVRHVKMFELPVTANVLADYAIAVLEGTRNPDAAQAFLDLVLSPEGQTLLERHGFVPVANGGR